VRRVIADRPIAQWLRSTRLRQLDEKGDPWTQDRLLELMRAEIDWAPHRPNYSKYERGISTPTRETLAKFVAFWEKHGEPGPDLTPPAEPKPPLDISALIEANTAALRDQTRAFLTLARSIDRAGGRVTGRVDDLGGVLAELLRAVRSPATGGSGADGGSTPAPSSGRGR
jgi:hypothetical protein